MSSAVINLVIAGCSILGIVVLWRLRKRAVRDRGVTGCPHCGYDTSGLPDADQRCPECGGDRFDERALRRRRRSGAPLVMLISMILLTALATERLLHSHTRRAIGEWTLPLRVGGMSEERLIAGVLDGPSIDYLVYPNLGTPPGVRTNHFFLELMRRLDERVATPESKARRLAVLDELERFYRFSSYNEALLREAIYQRYRTWHTAGLVTPEEVGEVAFRRSRTTVALRNTGNWSTTLGIEWRDIGSLSHTADRIDVYVHRFELEAFGSEAPLWSYTDTGAPHVHSFLDRNRQRRRPGTRVDIGEYAVPDPTGLDIAAHWDIEIRFYDSTSVAPFAIWRNAVESPNLEISLSHNQYMWKDD